MTEGRTLTDDTDRHSELGVIQYVNCWLVQRFGSDGWYVQNPVVAVMAI